MDLKISKICLKQPKIILLIIIKAFAFLRMLQHDDPCLDDNHQIIAGQPERSFNHHLSVGTGAPICDR